MDSIPKFLTSAFVIIVAVFLGISLIFSGVSMVSARSFYTNVADAISSVDSTHEKAMIEECTALAQENGYVLKAEKHITYDNKYYYELILEYKVVAMFFEQTHTGTVSGYVYPGMHMQSSST